MATVLVSAAGACSPSVPGCSGVERIIHSRPLGLPRGLSFPFPLRLLHATLQAPHFVRGVQDRLEVLAKAPPRRRHQNGLEKAPFQPLVPTPHSGRERAGGGPFGSGPRRQPAAGERRRLRRCWPLSVPSPGRCYLQSPKPVGPAASVLSAPHAPSGRRVAPAHLRGLRRELPHRRSRVALGGGPRCLRLESARLCDFPRGWRPETRRKFGKIPSLLSFPRTLDLLPP